MPTYVEIARFSPRHHSFKGAHYETLDRAVRCAERYRDRLAEQYPDTQVALVAFQEFTSAMDFVGKLTPKEWGRQACVALFPPPSVPAYVGHQRLPGDMD